MSFSFSVVHNGQLISDYSSFGPDQNSSLNIGGSSGSQNAGVENQVESETQTPRSSTGGLSTISNQDATSELIAAYETAFDEMTAGAIQSLENGINDMHAKNSETAAKAALKLGKGFTF